MYKDGGPVIAVQLENEYVVSGQIIPHLTALKRMAVEIGYDVPMYTMTPLGWIVNILKEKLSLMLVSI